MLLQNTKLQRVAVFSDIHSNYYAFRACYEDARANGAECFLFLGDYVSDLADPRKTLDLVYEIQSSYPSICLRGNRERYMLDRKEGRCAYFKGSKTGSLLYTYENLREKDFDFFKGLPIYAKTEINGVVMEIAHSIKTDDRYYFDLEDGCIDCVFSGMESSYLITGHSHRQYSKEQRGKMIINPGSIGVPHGSKAYSRYALLDIGSGLVHASLRQVPYDITAVIHAQFANGLVDCAQYWAIGVLYDIITGEEYTMQLLSRVSKAGDVFDEQLWHAAAQEMGMKTTEREILAFCAEYLQK